jgi:putative protease
MNGLRRAAAEAMDGLRAERSCRTREDLLPAEQEKVSRISPKRSKTAVFYDPAAVPGEAASFFDRIYLPLDRYDGSAEGVLLPPVIFDTEREEAETLLREAVRLGARYALVGNGGHMELARSVGLEIQGDFRLNVTNSRALAVWREAGIEDVILSPELTLARARDIGGRVIVYGRIPLMVTEKCVGRELGDCGRCRSGKTVLVDRRQTEFPVLREWKHRSLILNSVPVYMGDRKEELLRNGLLAEHFLFTTESREEIRQILLAYERGSAPRGIVRRMK